MKRPVRETTGATGETGATDATAVTAVGAEAAPEVSAARVSAETVPEEDSTGREVLVPEETAPAEEGSTDPPREAAGRTLRTVKEAIHKC